MCPVCGIEKDKDEFGVHTCCKDGLRAQCKSCRSELERPGNLKRKYGITAETYDTMWKSQSGLCACCGRPEKALHWKGKKRMLAINHDHVTGQVRQLICHRCNIMLGLAKESPEILRQLADYIARHLSSAKEEDNACNL